VVQSLEEQRQVEVHAGDEADAEHDEGKQRAQPAPEHQPEGEQQEELERVDRGVWRRKSRFRID
jgi:hypothetical protein